MDLTGKVVVVTGASSGIGAEIATAMGAAGADVTLVGRDVDRLAEVQAAIRDAGGAASTVVADLAAEEAPEQVVASVLGRHGSLDALVHSAGVFKVGPIEDGVDALERQWRLNVRAPYALTAKALPSLRGGGSVLFISSLAAKVGLAGTSAYAATKGAIEQLVRTLAVEEAPNKVRVNAIAPGHVRTPMNAELLADADYEAGLVKLTPLGRIGVPADIAPLAVLLASDGASFITGQSILVDGGWATA